MRTTWQSWIPSGREIAANVIASALVAVPSFLLAVVAAWFADANLTRLGTVLLVLGLAFGIALIWLFFAAGWRIIFPAPKQDEAAKGLAQAAAEAFRPFASSGALQTIGPTGVPVAQTSKRREWTAYEKDERAKQISDVLKFLETAVDAALTEARRLVEAHHLPLRNRNRAASYIDDLVANRDASREILKTLQRMASSCYADIATIFDEHEFSALISAEDNYIRSLGLTLQLPADTKLEILNDLLGPRVANFQIGVDDLRRWHATAKHDLIALRESGN